MWNIILLTALSGILGQIIHPIVFILYWTIGFQRYTETEPSKQSELLAKLKVKNSTITRDAKPFGIIYGKWFVGYISESEAEKKDGGEILDIIISIKKYEELTKSNSKKVEEKEKKGHEKNITLLTRSDKTYRRKYSRTPFDGGNHKYSVPSDYQKEIIDEMFSIVSLKPSNSGTFFFEGVPGTGKTMISLLMACGRDIFYTKTWNPTHNGDQLARLHKDVNPTKEKPLIIALNEVDTILKRLITGIPATDKYTDKPVDDKVSWNNLFDEITDWGMYPNTIVVLTSNLSIDDINKIDNSFLRPGRVDKCYRITTEMIPTSAGDKKKCE